MDHLPLYVYILFVAITFITVFLFSRASGRFRITLSVILALMTLQGVLALLDFFKVTDAFPPRLLFLVAPPFVIIASLFLTVKGRKYIDSMNLSTLTIMHSIRMVMELILVLLFTHKVMPQLMTFEGRNIDIFSGVTAPLVYYFGFVRRKLPAGILLAWNVLCFSILCFTVVNGVLSAPTPFQQFAFDQPNIAVLYFSFAWLAGIVVPVVLFAHLITIRRLAFAKRGIAVAV